MEINRNRTPVNKSMVLKFISIPIINNYKYFFSDTSTLNMTKYTEYDEAIGTDITSFKTQKQRFISLSILCVS